MENYDEKFRAMGIPELLQSIETMTAGDRDRSLVGLATMHYMAKCARELMQAEGIAPNIIERVVSKLTPTDPGNAALGAPLGARAAEDVRRFRNEWPSGASEWDG